MNVSLTEELEKFVSKKVKSGRYQSASEVIREGLRLLEEQDQIKAKRLADLEEQLLQGVRSPLSKLTKSDWLDIRRKGLNRLKTEKAE